MFSVRPHRTTDRPHPAEPLALPEAASDDAHAGLLSRVLQPIRSFRPAYLPLVMVYFASGALGIIDISRDLWIKERLTWTPAELAGIGVWLTLPWTMKMVVGALVDSVPIFGSQRRSYVMIGAALIAGGMLVLAGAAGRWLVFARANDLYVAGALLIVVGTVVQSVVAEAMSAEVVSRLDVAGNARPEHEVRAELGMVQVIGRLAVSVGILAVAGLSGWLASIFDRRTVFLFGLIVPAMSVTGVLLVRLQAAERRPLDWRIFGGGMAFGAVVLALVFLSVPFEQELIFALTLGAIGAMLMVLTRELDAKTRRAILFTSVVIFAFRAIPTAGPSYFWWTLDVLKFDAAFYGTLRQMSAIVSVAALWLFSRQLTEYAIARVLFWVAIAGTLLSLPSIALFYGLGDWTLATFGFGARPIVLVHEAVVAPFAEFSMIPLLTLIAFYAPAGRRATWFALMASLMNTALIASQLQSKYLNQVFVISRGNYAELGWLLIATVALGLILPMIALALFGRRV